MFKILVVNKKEEHRSATIGDIVGFFPGDHKFSSKELSDRFVIIEEEFEPQEVEELMYNGYRYDISKKKFICPN